MVARASMAACAAPRGRREAVAAFPRKRRALTTTRGYARRMLAFR